MVATSVAVQSGVTLGEAPAGRAGQLRETGLHALEAILVGGVHALQLLGVELGDVRADIPLRVLDSGGLVLAFANAALEFRALLDQSALSRLGLSVGEGKGTLGSRLGLANSGHRGVELM